MAYAALVSLEQTIDQILNQGRYFTSLREKKHIISLDKYVISFQTFLEDFPEKAKDLEGRIRDAAIAAEDLIERFMLEQIWKRYGCSLRLYEVAEEMDAIAAEVVEIKNSTTVIIQDEQQLIDSSIVTSSSGVGNIEMVGFDDDLTEIKAWLIGESQRLQFISIVGMGGIGKTTLAKNAYDDQLIQEQFQIRAWVTISQDYRAREILSCLLDSMREFDPKGDKQRNEESVAEMADRVYKILKGRRYIIVMDDTWSTKVLDDVRKLFPDDGNGSRIMLTARISDVAAYADSSIPPYEMRLMDENQSWDLLKQKVFAHKNIAPHHQLEIIGKEISRSCRGLPLAIVVIAGVLSNISETPASWEEIAKNIKTAMATSKDEQLEKILSLSYNHLPHHMRPCLIYMGFFPEDYRIRVSILIKLWVAEGFLKHPNGSSKTLEEGAEEYLEDLIRRNLILVTERKSNGKIKSCSLHDMVREACIRLLEEENNLRHVTVTDRALDNRKDHARRLSMRSIMQFDDNIKGSFEQYTLLRVLHVPEFVYNYEYYSQKMLKLYHLRYLCFRCYQPIPADISNFQNLQTLVIDDDEVKLPSSIWKVRQLRHLIFRGALPDPEGATSALENLQTLKEVHDLKYRAFLLGRIPNLRKLGVYDLDYYYSVERYLNESLVCLSQLEKLKIRFKVGRGNFLDTIIPGSLRKCTLYHCKPSVRFMEAICSLPNLEVLKLRDCSIENESLTVRGGEFPQLKFLMLDFLEITSFIVEDSSAFPRLKRLQLDRCFDLIEISDDIGEIPTLEFIEVMNSGIDVYKWARRVEEEQESFGNDTLQVRCIRPREGLEHSILRHWLASQPTAKVKDAKLEWRRLWE